jgi:chromosome segregation ATPase
MVGHADKLGTAIDKKGDFHMRSWFGIALRGIIVVALAGCGARVEVVKEKVLGQIDALLGKMDVERKQIELAMKGLQSGVEGIRKDKIKAKVKRDQIKEESSSIDAQVAKVDTALKAIRPHLDSKDTSEVSIEISGTKYTPAQIKSTAEKLIGERKRLGDKLSSVKTVENTLDQTFSALEKQQNDYQEKIKRLESKISQIDAQSIALKAKKEAAAAMAMGDDNLASSVKSLEDKVNGLLAEGIADLQSENERWNETMANKEIDNLDATISKFSTPSDTASEIDKILGGKK